MPGERTGELEFTGEVLTLDRLDLDQEGVYSCIIEGHTDLVKVQPLFYLRIQSKTWCSKKGGGG